MRNIIELARFTASEVLLSRVYIILLVTSLLVPILSTIFASLFMVDIGKVYLDALSGCAQLIASCFILFVCAPLMARDLEQNICHLLLTPPVSRQNYLLGRFAGLLVCFALLLLAVGICGGLGAQLYIQELKLAYQGQIVFGTVFIVIYFTFFQYIAFLGALYFFFSWATGAAEIMVFLASLMLMAWVFPPILHAMVNTEVATHVPSFIQGGLNWLYHLLPHLNGSNIYSYLAHDGGVPIMHAIWYTTEHLAYTAILLVLGIILFLRRDL